MTARVLSIVIAFVVTVVVVSVYSHAIQASAGLNDELVVSAPGHADEAREALLNARLPNVRSVDRRSGEHLSFGLTCIYSALYLAPLLLVFGGSFVAARRLIRSTPTI